MGLGGQNSPIRKYNIGFLLASHSDQSAISNRFRRTQQRYRQTDGQTNGRTDGRNWYSNRRPDAARYALASVAKTDRWGASGAGRQPTIIAASANIKGDCTGRVIVHKIRPAYSRTGRIYAPGSSRICIAHFAQRNSTKIKTRSLDKLP